MVTFDQVRLRGFSSARAISRLKTDRIYNESVTFPMRDGIAVVTWFEICRIWMTLIQENVSRSHLAFGKNENFVRALNNVKRRRRGHEKRIGKSAAILGCGADDFSGLLAGALLLHGRLNLGRVHGRSRMPDQCSAAQTSIRHVADFPKPGERRHRARSGCGRLFGRWRLLRFRLRPVAPPCRHPENAYCREGEATYERTQPIIDHLFTFHCSR